MKKLLMTMAASVAAIGLTYAEGEGGNDGGQGEAIAQPTLVELLNDFGDTDGFEQNAGEVFDTDAAPWGNGEVIWTTSEAESIVVDKVDNNYRLKLETAKDAPLLRTFADYGTAPEGEAAVDNRTITPIENQDVIVDAKITFTGFEEAPTPSDDDKILIWMKAVDEEKDADGNVKSGTGVTNLCITAGQLAEDRIEGPLSYDIVLSEPAVVGKEYQVTIKSVGNIAEAYEEGVLGFEVYIDGKQVKFSAAESDFWTGYTVGTQLDNVFPALIAGTTLKAAGFEGTGTIDDVLVCAADNEEMAPDFTQGGGEVVVDPIAPGGEQFIELDDAVAATNLAETINLAADKSQYITVPAGITASKGTYLGMFKAVVEGTKVLINLTEEAEKALQEEVDNLSTNATTSVGAIISTIASATADTSLVITGQPGFWYSIKAGAELDGMVEGDRAMAADGTGAVTLTVPVIWDKDDNTKKSGKGFYRVLINLEDKKKE